MFARIRSFLHKWDLMPILWPTREDGFFQIAIPLAIAAASFLGQKKDRDAQTDAAKQAARNQQAWSNAISPDALKAEFGEGTTIGDWMRSDKGEEQFSEGHSSTSTHSKQTPFITDEYKGLHGLTKGMVESRLKSGSSLPQGYEAAGIRSINRAFQGAESLGRTGEPGGDSMQERAEVGRRGQIADFLSGVPLQERRLQQEDLSFAAGLIAQFGKGMDIQSHSSTSSSSRSWTEGGLPPGQQFLLQSYLNSQQAKYGGAQQPVGGDPGFGAAANAGLMGYQAYLAGRKNG